MSQTSRRLLARLHRDLRELTEEHYPGVAVFTDEADLRKFCLVLTPPSGPWTGLNLHFDVVLPQTWPAQPPSVACTVHGINHPNLFGSYICCDLIKPPEWLEQGYTGGYSPALTLRGLFLQFLTFFSTNKVEQDYGGASVIIGDYITGVFFVKEKDLPASLNPWEKCSHLESKCDCKPIPEDHSQLEAAWNALDAKEIILGTYTTPAGTMMHKVKSQNAAQSRIHKFEKINSRWNATLKLISKFKCAKCPYGSAALPYSRAVGEESEPIEETRSVPSTGRLDLLNDDVLLEMAEPMTSESVISFGKAYPRFHSLVSTHHILLQRELHCFFLKTPMREAILGVGVALDDRSRMLSSDFDWLSMEAFDMHKVRKSIQKRDFEFFLPLAFSEAHFERSKQEVWKRLHQIRGAIRQIEFDMNARRSQPGGYRGQRGRSLGSPPPEAPQNSVKVIFRMMNNIVVSLMKSCDDAISSASAQRSSPVSGISTASEKAIISYCHLMHLLTCLSRTYPAILQDAIARLKLFVASPQNRTKDAEPDLGELLVAVTLVLVMSPSNQPNSPSWSMFNGPILEEAITRNARWVLKDAPELEVLETGASDYRLATTFEKSKTSLRLLMFQVTFLGLFIKLYQGNGVKVLDQNYGFPVKELPEMMVAEIKDIYGVNSWPRFFDKVRWAKARDPSFTKEKFTDMLRSAIKKSAERGYHRPASRQMIDRMRRRRSLIAKDPPAQK